MRRFKPLRLAILIITFTFLETTFFSNILFSKANVELLLMLVVFMGLFSLRKQALITAFFCGLSKDIFSIQRFGVHMVTFIFFIFIIEKISRNFFRENKLIFYVFVFIATLLFGIISFLLTNNIPKPDFLNKFLVIVLPTSFVSTLFSPLIFSLLESVLLKNESK